MSKMEGKTNFSRCLKQFDGLTCLTLTPVILRQFYANGLRATPELMASLCGVGHGVSWLSAVRVGGRVSSALFLVQVETAAVTPARGGVEARRR